MDELRNGASERITGVIWGLIVSGIAVTAMVALSGEDVDTTTLIIVGLSILGGWLLISALLAIRPRKRQPDAVVTDAVVTDAVVTDAVVTDADPEPVVTDDEVTEQALTTDASGTATP